MFVQLYWHSCDKVYTRNRRMQEREKCGQTIKKCGQTM